MMKLWQKLTAAALMSAAMLGTGLTAKPLLPVPAGTEITAAAAEDITVYGLNFRKYDTYAVVTGCTDPSAAALIIPAKVDGLPVTGIGAYAFRWCDNLTVITIPDSVTSIGDGAFYNCLDLTSITIPDSVTSIGIFAFENTMWLKAKQSETPLVIANHILIDGTTAEGDVVIPDGVTAISDSAFFDGTDWTYSDRLTSVVIPGSVKSIGDFVFKNCIALKSVTISDGVTGIGDFAFEWCTGLTSITIPKSMTYIGREAFSNCYRLKSITIPESVTSIGRYAFENCVSLKSITIPDSVSSIGDGVFYYCENLTDITIPDSVTGIGDFAFGECEELKNITIPESVTSIGERAFINSPNLTVKGAAGSYAERYAAENSIPFEQKTFLHSTDVKLSKTDFACTGSPVKIGNWITVTVNGRKLTYGTDFVTVYRNNVDVGYQTASVTVKGRGEYAGQITKKFTIKPAKPAKPTLTTANGGIHVTWQRDANADGVLVRYSKDSTFSSSHDAVYTTKTATELKKFTKPGETWYVKIYSFIKLPDGTKRGSWSDAVSIRVK